MEKLSLLTWKNIEKTSPKLKYSRSGTIANQNIEDISSDSSHTNAAAIKIIIRMGSWAIVKMNIASGGPKAKNVHPKNSETVIAYQFRGVL